MIFFLANKQRHIFEVMENKEPIKFNGKLTAQHFEYVKRNVDLSEFLETEIGVVLRWSEPNISANCICPLHGDTDPSFYVTLMEEDGIWVYHCLAGDTKIITWDGIVPIREISGTTQKILTTEGKWVEAPFFNFGRQKVSEITLTRNRQKKVVKATSEHRWFVKNGHSKIEKQTKELEKGMRLAWVFPKNNKKWIKRGWVVDSIEIDVGTEEVYCAIVDKTHSFALEDNILTGNCFGCEAKGTIIDLVQAYYSIETAGEAVVWILNKFGWANNEDLIINSLKDVPKKINIQKKIECANIVTSNQCRLLLRKNYAKYNKWVGDAYKRMNKALDEGDIDTIESMGYELSTKLGE